ncbi:serine hydrolase domain-containing protein [Acidicapsa dinghuensis]|uniref:Serine hydrolase domain-containing protein n=1 Tax=Acidicapsa dinghuensis TaxID=2218256 RepID=A0ABW1EC89_9BACT|nr:serine hydrolase domain-containing protein [Acidicapsa dinghuensis]
MVQLYVCLVLCSTAIAVQAQPHTQDQWLSYAQRAAIDRVFADYTHNDTPGYALAIIHDDRFAYARGYGMANLDDEIPITPETSFHLASVSKQFTAAAIALLVLDGKISLSDPVAKYIPEAAKYGDGLRIEHLVYMTSGLHEYTDLKRKSGMPWVSFYYFTRDEAIATSLAQDKLEFAPGTDWAYRNINYMLLTKIVEVVSHEPFAQFMRERIFLPLGMTQTLIDDDTTEVIPHRATGYAERSNPRVAKELADVGVLIHPDRGRPTDRWVRLVRVSPHFGGSGVFSTLDDLLLWDRNWYTGTIGGAKFTALMNTRKKFQHDKDDDALGLVWRSFYATSPDQYNALDYSGGDTDTSTYMVRFPERHITVICLANMPLGDAEGHAHQVMDLLHAWGKL